MDKSVWCSIPGGFTASKGFQAAGIAAGLKPSSKPDLALILAPEGTVCAGSFTKSLVRAACVRLSIERLDANLGSIRAVLINSGQANACTGEQGAVDSLQATQAVAERLSLSSEQVLICSTGVIGEPIPMKRLLEGINPLVAALSDNGGGAMAEAILTTDLKKKQFALEANLGGRLVRLGGVAKGSGMIHPDMATMLGFISCDAAVPRDIWQEMIQRVVDQSFNSITVDGDTSTNDAVLAMAAGKSLPEEQFAALEVGLLILAQQLAMAIARDGEGANCLLQVEVQGPFSDSCARLIARTICASSLVKTAVNGCDPNWGRIVAAAARAGVAFDPNHLALWFGPYQLLQGGEILPFNRESIVQYMRSRFQGTYLVDDKIEIRLVIGDGQGVGVAWGCDLSDEYVRINSDYTT